MASPPLYGLGMHRDIALPGNNRAKCLRREGFHPPERLKNE